MAASPLDEAKRGRVHRICDQIDSQAATVRREGADLMDESYRREAVSLLNAYHELRILTEELRELAGPPVNGRR